MVPANEVDLMASPRRFGEFRRALSELARVPADVSRPAAVRIQRLMRRGFRRGADPYGKAYEPLAPASLERGRRPPPLRKFQRQAGASPLPSAGLTLTVSHPQAGFHQTGTQHMPQRKVLPDRALPRAWRDVLEDEMRKAIRRRMRGAA